MWSIHPDLKLHLTCWSDSAACYDLKSCGVWALSLAGYAVVDYLMEVGSDSTDGIVSSFFEATPPAEQYQRLALILDQLADTGLLVKVET